MNASKPPSPLPRWVPAALGAGVGLGLVALAVKSGLGLVLLLMSGAALIGVIWLAFRAVQSITEPDDDVFLVPVPTPAEMQKQTALRALRDIEYERLIGNLSDADYAEIEARYRAEAKTAMRAVDDERREKRRRAEDVARRATEADTEDSPDETAADDGSEATASEQPSDEREEANAPRDPRVGCPKCETKNEPDARFCKSCGEKMETAA